MIVLLHGFAANRWMMRRLNRTFRGARRATTNWGYSSLFQPIETHASALAMQIEKLDDDATVQRIDFVTHSMGCIVARAALLKGLSRKCGRWVMLAPPNHGSHAALRFPKVVRRVLKPIEELAATESSYVNQLAVPQGIELGVIQATADWVVREESTRLQEEKDRFVVPGLHSAMLFREDVAQQCLSFLERGHFETRPS